MQRSMESYPKAAVERAMKVQEVILRAMAKKITWIQAAYIARMSDRQIRDTVQHAGFLGREAVYLRCGTTSRASGIGLSGHANSGF